MSPRARLLTPLAIVFLTGSLCVVFYEHYTRWLPALQADETGHALPAARMAFDLRRGDLGAFVADTEREMTWPFVHPWALTAFFLLGGVSTGVGRASSIAFFGSAVVLAFLLARELARATPSEADADSRSRRDGIGALVGVPSALLMVLTPDFWTHSSYIMIEPLGMAMSLASLLAYAVALRRPAPGPFLLAGLLAALTFLTKYNYGLPLFGALALSTVLARGDRRPRGRELAFLVGALALPVAVWLAYPFPEKLQALYGFSVNRDEGLSGFADLLFYPVQIASLVSWPVTLWLLAAALLSLRRLRDPRAATPVLFALLSLAMITVHPNKQLRYCFPLLPVLYVLAELELGRIARRVLPERARAVVWGVVLVTLAFTLDPRPVLKDQRRDAERLGDASRIIDFVVTGLDPKERTLVLGSCGLLPHLLVQWELVTRKGAVDAVVDHLAFPGEGEWDSRYRQGYPRELTPDYDRVLQRTLRAGGYDRVVAFEVAPGSVFMPDWLARWDAWGQNYVVLMERQTLYPLLAEEAFPESGVRVRIYGTRPAGQGSAGVPGSGEGSTRKTCTRWVESPTVPRQVSPG